MDINYNENHDQCQIRYNQLKYHLTDAAKPRRNFNDFYKLYQVINHIIYR